MDEWLLFRPLNAYRLPQFQQNIRNVQHSGRVVCWFTGWFFHYYTYSGHKLCSDQLNLFLNLCQYLDILRRWYQIMSPNLFQMHTSLCAKNGIKHALSCCQAKTARPSVKGDNFVMACFFSSLLIFAHSFVGRLQSDLWLGVDVHRDESLGNLSSRHWWPYVTRQLEDSGQQNNEKMSKKNSKNSVYKANFAKTLS